MDIANLVPIMDTGVVAQSMAMKAEKNLNVGMVSVEPFEGNASAGLAMYLCLLLHLFTTDMRINLCWRARNPPLTNLQRPKEVQEHFMHMISPRRGVHAF